MNQRVVAGAVVVLAVLAAGVGVWLANTGTDDPADAAPGVTEPGDLAPNDWTPTGSPGAPPATTAAPAGTGASCAPGDIDRVVGAPAGGKLSVTVYGKGRKCALEGFPEVVLADRAPLPAKLETGLVSAGATRPATVDGSHPARFEIATCSGSTLSHADLRVMVEDQEFRLDGTATLTSGCPYKIGPWHTPRA